VRPGRANQHTAGSPDGAKRNPGPPFRMDGIPDYAEPVIGRRFAPTRWLHPGFKISGHNPLRCPSGKTPKPSVNPRRQKDSALPKFGKRVCVVATRPKDKGRIAIVTNAGRAAVDADDIGAKGFRRAGNRERGHRAHDRCDWRTAKSCGPGARSLASSLVAMCGPTGPHIGHPQGDGAIVQRSRGEHDISRSNHCAGKAGMSPVALFSAMQQHTQSALGMAVHGSQPAPGLPCALVQSRARQPSKARAR